MWDWITGKKSRTEETADLDVYVPEPVQPPACAPDTSALVFPDPRVEALCRDLSGALSSPSKSLLMQRGASLQVARSQSGLAAVALELLDVGRNDEEKLELARRSLQHLQVHQVPGPWSFGRELLKGPRYASQKVAIAQLVLASTATEAAGLAGLGLAATRALDSTYHAADVCTLGEKSLRRLDTPAARLALKLGQSVRYDTQKIPIYETFLEQFDKTLAPELVAAGLQAASQLSSTYAAQDRAAVGRTLLEHLAGDPSVAPMLSLGLEMGRAVRYDNQRLGIYETALSSCQTKDPVGLARQGQAMLAQLSPTYAAQDRAAASTVLLQRLKKLPETESLADLALLMLAEVRYDSQKVALADEVLAAISQGQTSELSVARQAMSTISSTYAAQDLNRVAMAVLERTDNPDAKIVLAAMRAVRYDNQRVEMAKVVFNHLLASEPPPFSQLAAELLGSLSTTYAAQDIVAAGRVLSGRYSNPRARALLDGALSKQYDHQKAEALKEAFRGIQEIDDDVTEIKKMAKAVTGQDQTTTIAETQGAVLVGGVRLRVRKVDCETAAA
ncbi:hypothetical protein DYH09_02660 [bacterium CPR1]|nr:hypothetical protein [bacterium CPR1]